MRLCTSPITRATALNLDVALGKLIGNRGDLGLAGALATLSARTGLVCRFASLRCSVVRGHMLAATTATRRHIRSGLPRRRSGTDAARTRRGTCFIAGAMLSLIHI